MIFMKNGIVSLILWSSSTKKHSKMLLIPIHYFASNLKNMDSLSTHIITHFAFIEKEDKKIPLTREQADVLRLILKNESFQKYVSIPDPKDPLWDPLWEWRAWSIKITQNERSWISSGDRWICDFWIRHVMSESCGCPDKYKVIPIDFRIKMYELYPRMYAKNLSAEQRKIILENITL